MSKKDLTFENHRISIAAGTYASIEKLMAVDENAHGPIEVLDQTATTASYRFKTEAGYNSKRRGMK